MNFNSTKYYLLLLLFIAAPFFSPAAITILQPYTDTMVCQNGSFNVTYTVSSAYNAGNVFTAQLSDATGSFSSVSNIGTLAATGSGSIAVSIPSSIPVGSKYRIRIVASNPFEISADNGKDIQIFSGLSYSISSNSPVCVGDMIQLNAVAGNAITPLLFSWFGPAVTNNNNQNIVLPNATTAMAGTYTLIVQHNGCPNLNVAKTVTVSSFIPPTPSISSNGPLCAGSNLMLSTTAVGVQFAWTGPNGFKSNSASPTITGIGVSGAGYYYLVDTLNGCRSPKDSIYVSVTPSLTPSISIVPSTTSTICAGELLNFTSTIVNGGATPTYQWNVNGFDVSGAIGDHYGAYSFNDNDIVYCTLTSSLTSCVSSPVVTSNRVTVSVSPIVTPYVTISANLGTTFTPGAGVTFTATVVGGGTAPSYQWLVNNVPFTAATFSSFTTHTLNEGDVVTCVVTSNAPCTTTPFAISNSLTMHVVSGVHGVTTALDDVNLFPVPNNGSFSILGDVNGNAGKEMTIQVINATGQLVANTTGAIQNGKINQAVNLPASLPGGIYLLRLYVGQESRVFRFNVQRN